MCEDDVQPGKNIHILKTKTLEATVHSFRLLIITVHFYDHCFSGTYIQIQVQVYRNTPNQCILNKWMYTSSITRCHEEGTLSGKY